MKRIITTSFVLVGCAALLGFAERSATAPTIAPGTAALGPVEVEQPPVSATVPDPDTPAPTHPEPPRTATSTTATTAVPVDAPSPYVTATPADNTSETPDDEALPTVEHHATDPVRNSTSTDGAPTTNTPEDVHSEPVVEDQVPARRVPNESVIEEPAVAEPALVPPATPDPVDGPPGEAPDTEEPERCVDCWRLDIPTIGLSTDVIAGGQPVIDTYRGVALIKSFTSIDAAGNGVVWLAGHRTSHGGVFGGVPSLSPGTAIHLTEQDGTTRTYHVRQLFITSHDRVTAFEQVNLRDKSERRLLLQTSHPDVSLRYVLEAVG